MEDRTSSEGERLIKYRTLSLIEQGYGDPKIATLYEIAKALNVSLSELLGIDSSEKKEISTIVKIDEIKQRIQNMNNQDLDKVLAFLKLFN